ncbi:GNAT family N-acetyltransferase [Candidatus Bathyarchaeota archaeon]|nr:GNAT family N-acetyltransferase [Candidatus Bathyarchaeota archaeon]
MAYKTLRLRDMSVATLSWLDEKNLPQAVEALNSVIREGKYLYLNDEIVDMEEEHRWFERSVNAGMLYLIARVQGKVVGGASMDPQTDKRAHVAQFGIFICDGYRNLGLGTEMLKEFIEIAKKRGFEILQLSVFANNTKALNVYKKCGFKEIGRLSRDIKFLDGRYTDRILLELPLKDHI